MINFTKFEVDVNIFTKKKKEVDVKIYGSGTYVGDTNTHTNN